MRIAWADLNGDGRPEALAYTNSCGTDASGCDLYVLAVERSRVRRLGMTSVAQLPVTVLRSRAHGYRDLSVDVCGGGIVNCYRARLRFDGARYPDNASVAPRLSGRAVGKDVISEGTPSVPIVAEPPAHPALLAKDSRIAAIRAVLQRDLVHASADDRKAAKFAIGFVDLNSDGVDEAIVWGPIGPAEWCGTGGCGIGIYVRQGARWKLKSSTSIGWPPVGVLDTKHYGWRDITIGVSGGGINPGYRAVLAYNGSRYPFNPSVPPAKPMKGSAHEALVIPRYERITWLPLFP